jgi:hypothetical protein
MNGEIYSNMTSDEYHKGRGISASDVISINDMGFDGWLWRKRNPKETEALALGTLTHKLLEVAMGRASEREVAVRPHLDLRTKGGKEMAVQFEAANTGKLIAPQDDYDHARRMIDAVMAEPEAVGYLRGGLSESSIFVRHPDLGVLMKCRPDVLREQDGLCINFKTTRDSTERGFIKSIADYSLDFQSSFYLQVLEIAYGRSFNEIHINVQKTPDGGPCRVGIHTIPDEVLSFARTQYQPILRRIKEYEETGKVERILAALSCPNVPDWAVTKGAYV